MKHTTDNSFLISILYYWYFRLDQCIAFSAWKRITLIICHNTRAHAHSQLPSRCVLYMFQTLPTLCNHLQNSSVLCLIFWNFIVATVLFRYCVCTLNVFSRPECFENFVVSSVWLIVSRSTTRYIGYTLYIVKLYYTTTFNIFYTNKIFLKHGNINISEGKKTKHTTPKQEDWSWTNGDYSIRTMYQRK